MLRGSGTMAFCQTPFCNTSGTCTQRIFSRLFCRWWSGLGCSVLWAPTCTWTTNASLKMSMSRSCIVNQTAVSTTLCDQTMDNAPQIPICIGCHHACPTLPRDCHYYLPTAKWKTFLDSWFPPTAKSALHSSFSASSCIYCSTTSQRRESSSWPSMPFDSNALHRHQAKDGVDVSSTQQMSLIQIKESSFPSTAPLGVLLKARWSQLLAWGRLLCTCWGP